jgi:hypothetical protein
VEVSTQFCDLLHFHSLTSLGCTVVSKFFCGEKERKKEREKGRKKEREKERKKEREKGRKKER